MGRAESVVAIAPLSDYIMLHDLPRRLNRICLVVSESVLYLTPRTSTQSRCINCFVHHFDDETFVFFFECYEISIIE